MIPKKKPPHILYKNIFEITNLASTSNVFGYNLDIPEKHKNIRMPEASLSNDSSSIMVIN